MGESSGPNRADEVTGDVEESRLVARAVSKLWRRAYETDSFATLNIARDPS